MRRRRFIMWIIVILASFFSACTNDSSPREKIIKPVMTSVIVEPTSEVLLQVDNNEEVGRFAREILDITSNCKASTFLYDLRSDTILYGYKAGINSIREKCDLEQIDIDIPENCEACRNVIPIIQEHAKLMMEGAELIEKANASFNQVLLTEGLEKFWEADIVAKDADHSIDSIRTDYNLPVVLTR